MTHDEAASRAARLNAKASADEHWLVRGSAAEGWAVVRLTGPGVAAVRPSGTRTEARPRPEEPADPRPAIIRNIPPYGAA